MISASATFRCRKDCESHLRLSAATVTRATGFLVLCSETGCEARRTLLFAVGFVGRPSERELGRAQDVLRRDRGPWLAQQRPAVNALQRPARRQRRHGSYVGATGSPLAVPKIPTLPPKPPKPPRTLATTRPASAYVVTLPHNTTPMASKFAVPRLAQVHRGPCAARTPTPTSRIFRTLGRRAVSGNRTARDENGEVLLAALLADPTLAPFPVSSFTQESMGRSCWAGAFTLRWGLPCSGDGMAPAASLRAARVRAGTDRLTTSTRLPAVQRSGRAAQRVSTKACDPPVRVPDWRNGDVAGCSMILYRARHQADTVRPPDRGVWTLRSYRLARYSVVAGGSGARRPF